MLIGLLFSLLLVAIGSFVPAVEDHAVALLGRVDFNRVLMEGLLGLLLFAGALHVDLDDLLRQRRIIGLLATLGPVVSTLLVACLMWLALLALAVPLPFVLCLLFGALISPTDPIAVLGVLKSLGAPHSLETKIAGESLFNDGVAVVIFLALLGLTGLDPAHGGGEDLAGSVLALFALEALGGVAFGLVSGFFVYRLMRGVDQPEVEILLSLALVVGGYAAARALHVSGPLAMVVAGLFIGNRGRRFGMTERTRESLDIFWRLIDEVLNAVLFVLIGLEVLIVPFDATWSMAGVVAIGAVLLGRWVAVVLPITALRPLRGFTPHAVKILTWGGLRGGISVALALSLRTTLGRRDAAAYEGILVMTYIVVVFSILVQGLTIAPLIKRLRLGARGEARG